MTPGVPRPPRAGADHPRTQHVASKLHEIRAAIKSAGGASAAADLGGVGEADPSDLSVHLMPPGTFLGDHSLQQTGVESYLADAMRGLLDEFPSAGEMWVPSHTDGMQPPRAFI